jgi:hypothetical protein
MCSLAVGLRRGAPRFELFPQMTQESVLFEQVAEPQKRGSELRAHFLPPCGRRVVRSRLRGNLVTSAVSLRHAPQTYGPASSSRHGFPSE